jgi:hypothetical protein
MKDIAKTVRDLKEHTIKIGSFLRGVIAYSDDFKKDALAFFSFSQVEFQF